MIAPLCERHPVYTPDTIGTAGRSVQTAPIGAPGDLVMWLDDVLDALELDSVHLVGYSEGGWIAGLHTALSNRPDGVRTLTLIEPGGAIERIPRPFIAALILRGARALLARDKHQAIRDLNRWMDGDVVLTDDQIELLLLAMRTFRQKRRARVGSPMTSSVASRCRPCCCWRRIRGCTTPSRWQSALDACCPT